MRCTFNTALSAPSLLQHLCAGLTGIRWAPEDREAYAGVAGGVEGVEAKPVSQVVGALRDMGRFHTMVNELCDAQACRSPRPRATDGGNKDGSVHH